MNFFQRLFLQPKNNHPEEDAPPQPKERVDHSDVVTSTLRSLPPGLHVGRRSDVGQVRERNEDSLYTITTAIYHNQGEEPFGVYIVADGMGGHAKGDVASKVAARTTAQAILEEIYLPTLSNNSQANNSRPINEVLIDAVEKANVQVQKSAPEGGTTLTAAMLMGNSAYIAHVGDTRAYLFNNEGLKQITEDHSLAQHLRATGQATPEQIAQIENVLYRAIGQGGAVEADTHVQHLPAGSSLLICSDGLWKGIDDDEQIGEVLSQARTPQEACEKLVEIANENGGEDNITAIIVSMGLED